MTQDAHKASRFRLSKSKIAAFEHCPKRLWLQIHDRDAARFEEATLKRFAFGHAVGVEACKKITDGIMIEAIPDIQAALNRTTELVISDNGAPIFEATFQYQDVLVRVDILERTSNGWRAIEVKATTRVREYHLADLATQIWVMRGCGLNITSAVVRHAAGRINWLKPDASLIRFRDTDVSLALEGSLTSVESAVIAARQIVRGPEPSLAMGAQCFTPFICEFQQYCRQQSSRVPGCNRPIASRDRLSPSED